QKKLIMLPSETMIWQPEFTDKTLSRKPGAVQYCDIQHLIRYGADRKVSSENLQLFSRFLIGHHYSFRH
ncbi:hypothetical protein, partial [Escherichia coli]|uniref:hypothetical protein n=1 Tax=Escherichia coli TaxID=562 RepID=UPI00197C2812